MSFKDRDESPAEKKAREFSENPNNFDPIRPTFCLKCRCHYSNGCKEHDRDDQVSLAKSPAKTEPAVKPKLKNPFV